MKRAMRPGHCQFGMTLIEVMVSVLVLSIGLLGLAAQQMRATQFSVSAEDSNRAALLANEIAATMQLYQTVNIATGASPVVDALYTAWQLRVADSTLTGLADGAGTVTKTGAKTADIQITWVGLSATANAPRRQYVTQLVLP